MIMTVIVDLLQDAAGTGCREGCRQVCRDRTAVEAQGREGEDGAGGRNAPSGRAWALAE